MENNFIKNCIENFILGKIEEEFKNYSVRESLLNKEENKKYVYNEMSFQHELGEYIRERLKNIEGDYRVQFERNKSSFGIEKSDDIKKSEIDIVIIDFDNEKYYAIELKYHKYERARYPDTMFDCVKDIDFLHKIVNYPNSKFEKGYCVTIVEDAMFYKNTNQNNYGEKLYNNYWCFRNIKAKEKNDYKVHKTGTKKEQEIDIEEYVNKYQYLPIREQEEKDTSSWKKICDVYNINKVENEFCNEARYYIVEIKKDNN